MEISMTSLARMTLYAFFLGIGLGALYDVIRISRVMAGVRYARVGALPEKLYEKKWPLIGVICMHEGKVKRYMTDIFVLVGDILYCTVSGVIFCIFIYYTNNGIFRFQSLAAVVVGFFCYYKTVGRLVITFAEYICFFLKIFVNFLAFAIAFPIKILYNILIKVSNKLFGKRIQRFYEKKRLRKAEKEKQRLASESVNKPRRTLGKDVTRIEKNI